MQAVLGRTARPLHAAQGPSRSSRIGPGSVAVTTTLGDWTGSVTVVPLLRLGWLWVMHDRALPTGEPHLAAQGVCEVLGSLASPATDVALLDELHDRAWPPRPAADGSSVVVCRSLGAAVPAADLHRSWRSALPSTLVRITAVPGVAYLLLGASSGPAVVQSALARVEADLHVPLGAVVAPVVGALGAARAAAEEALDARVVEGRCLTLADCRPYVVLPRLLDCLDDASDPVAGLDDTAAGTLLAWLDRSGDVAAVAADLGVHVNTIRYRLKQLTKNVDVDLQDPIARIDLHLRLLRARGLRG